MDKTYRNVGYFFMLLIPLTFFAFYRTYINQFPSFDPKFTVMIHLHAVIAGLWIFIIISQPLFLRYRNVRAHRMVGKASYIIFPLLILSFIPQILRIVQSGNYKFLFFPVGDGLLLIAFYALAIYHKKKVHRHMRYIIAGTLVFLGPTVGRIGPIFLQWSDLLTQNIQYTIIFSVLGLLILYDKKNGRKYQPYLVAMPLFAMHVVAYYILFT